MATADLVIVLAGVTCEMILLAFLYLIGRFYQMKFGKSTYAAVFLAPITLFIIMLAAIAFAGFDAFLAAMLVNIMTLVVLIGAGASLYWKMTGVSK